MASCNNPFVALKARLVLISFFAISIGLTLVFGTLGALEVLPIQGDDPILAPILYSLIFLGLCAAILNIARRVPLDLGALFGPWPRQLAWVQLLWLVVGVFLFSLGAFQVSYLGLSWVVPEWVEGALQQSLSLSAGATAPGLYNVLVLISVLVVAPLPRSLYSGGCCCTVGA
jgi:hypothetical protein